MNKAKRSEVVKKPSNNDIIGSKRDRVDGIKKVTGRAQYGSDIKKDSLIYAAILRSDRSHGKILSVDTEDAWQMEGVKCVLSRMELMGKFDNRVRHYGDIIAAVAADKPETAKDAVNEINYSIQPMDSVHESTEAIKKAAPTVHEPESPLKTYSQQHGFTVENDAYKQNIDDYHSLDLGDVDSGFEEADFVYEDSYVNPRVDHCNLDTHCTVAEWQEDELVITETIASPGHGEELVSDFLEIDVDKVTIRNPPVASSSFGGRSLPKLTLEPVAASLAKETETPVKLWFDRQEEFVATSSRHRTQYKIKTGVTKDGSITAMKLNTVADTGAYPNGVGHIVLSNSEKRVLDLYRIPNYRYEGVSVFTNNIPAGEYRGIGVTQLMFALESHIDEITRRMKLDPIEFRLHNFVKEGDERLYNDNPIESCGLIECVERGKRTFERIKTENLNNCKIKTGTGIAAGSHTTGSGSHNVDSTSVRLILDEDGTLHLYTSAVDTGQGADTVLTQILERETGIPAENIEILPLPKKGPLEDPKGSVASRTTYIIGSAVADAAKQLKTELQSTASKRLGVNKDKVKIQAGSVRTVSGETVTIADLLAETEEPIQVTGYAESATTPPAYSVHFAEVEVDIETGNVDVVTYVAAQDVGFAINPQLVEGQIEGAVQHGIEFALYSELKFDHGNPINTNLADYPAISPLEMPEQLVCEIIESNEKTGPYGAKGVGTPVMPPIAPAILNALRDAIGIRFEDPPVHSEDVFLELQGDQK